MSKTYLYAVFLSAILSTFYISTPSAAIVVYTDRATWETDILTGPFHHFHDQNFENIPTGSLLTGSAFTNFFFPLDIIISGTPGFNAIDDSFTADPFSNALSPNGSTYYLGEVNSDAQVVPTLSFPELEYVVTGFAADWIVQGDLIMELQGTLIPVSTFLPTGSGFLGIITDQAESPLIANLSGSAVFGMDDVRTANAVPIPTAVWMFGSGLMILVGMVKMKGDRSIFSAKESV